MNEHTNLQDHMNNSNITKEALPVNNQHEPTIRRGKHDKEHPYVMISKAVFQDKKLSLKAKGALGYLLSLPDNWITHPRQVAEELGISKNCFYTVLKELMLAGYANREEIKCSKGRFSSVEYCFYEDKLPMDKRFKEKSTVSQKRDTDSRDPEKGTLQNTHLTEYIPLEDISSLKVPEDPAAPVAAKAADEVLKEDKPKRKKEKSEFSPKVREVAEEMVNIIIKHEPEYVPPKNLAPFMTEVDFMLRVDKRESQKVYDVLNWSLSDSFWRDKMFKPNPAKYLREKFLQLKNKMESKPIESNKVDRRTKNIDGTPVDAPHLKDLF